LDSLANIIKPSGGFRQWFRFIKIYLPFGFLAQRHEAHKGTWRRYSTTNHTNHHEQCLGTPITSSAYIEQKDAEIVPGILKAIA